MRNPPTWRQALSNQELRLDSIVGARIHWYAGLSCKDCRRTRRAHIKGIRWVAEEFAETALNGPMSPVEPGTREEAPLAQFGALADSPLD